MPNLSYRRKLQYFGDVMTGNIISTVFRRGKTTVNLKVARITQKRYINDKEKTKKHRTRKTQNGYKCNMITQRMEHQNVTAVKVFNHQTNEKI